MPSRLSRAALSLLALLALALAPRPPQAAAFAAAAEANAGYIGPSFFYNPSGQPKPNVVVSPTGEKPQSKLWHAGGRWWASMFSPAARQYRIFALDWKTQRWAGTGTPIDDRPQTKADCLWDGARLYVVSGGGVESTGRDLDARLYRYSFAGGVYRLDAGFPVTVRAGGAEAIAIAKDTAGRLWITYTQQGKVYVRHSTTSDAAWGAPFVVPAAGANASVSADDISAIVAYDGKIGVLWSNQGDDAFYFAYHVDGAPASSWIGGVAARRGDLADDHINIASLQSDRAGSVFAVVKTSMSGGSQPSIAVLVGSKQSGGSLAWRRVTVTNGSQRQTRPIMLIDTSNRRMYVFTADEGGGAIFYKVSDLDDLAFEANTPGTPFIRHAGYPYFNDPTSTKQSVDAATNLVVLASYDNGGHPSATPAATDVYAHNAIDLPAPPLDQHVYLAVVRR
jgi:hypothetical protein